MKNKYCISQTTEIDHALTRFLVHFVPPGSTLLYEDLVIML